MPTPPLTVLHALLTAIELPSLTPPSLQATPPTLLLLLLDHLHPTGRVPLSPRLRRPSTPHAEIALTKCILGVLSSLLAMDLSAVDPQRAVEGSEADLAVVVMALAVAARRRGVVLDLEGDDDEREESLLDIGEVWLPERQPLEPLPAELVTPPRRRDKPVVDFDPLASVEHKKPKVPKTVLQSMIEEFGLQPG